MVLGCQSRREYSKSCACLCTRCSSGTLLITLPACWRPPLTFLHGRRCLRSSSNCDLIVPRTSRKIGDSAFSVTAPRAWNRLPTDLKLLRSTATSKSKLKSFLFHTAYTGNTMWTLKCAIGLIVGGALQVTVVTVIATSGVSLTHSLVDLPRWGLATADDHSDIFLLHCAQSCNISFSWMYSQPVHSSMSCIHCLLGLPWCRNPSMIPSRTVSPTVLHFPE